VPPKSRELRPLRGMLEDVAYRGRDGVREFQRDNMTAWPEGPLTQPARLTREVNSRRIWCASVMFMRMTQPA
jgi:hypothetical protein